jgi:hypothetical protein
MIFRAGDRTEMRRPPRQRTHRPMHQLPPSLRLYPLSPRQLSKTQSRVEANSLPIPSRHQRKSISVYPRSSAANNEIHFKPLNPNPLQNSAPEHAHPQQTRSQLFSEIFRVKTNHLTPHPEKICTPIPDTNPRERTCRFQPHSRIPKRPTQPKLAPPKTKTFLPIEPNFQPTKIPPTN